LSLANTDSIDAIGIRDGVAHLTIFHLEALEDADAELFALCAKMDLYRSTIEDEAFQSRFYQLPVVIELVLGCEVAPPLRDMCDQWGVQIRESAETG